jgi:Phage tail lysozyme
LPPATDRRRLRPSAALAALICATLLLSGCADLMALMPARLALTAPPPAPRPAPPPVPAPVAARRAEPSTPQQVRAEIYRFFAAAGYQPFHAAALMRHAKRESGYRPCAVGPAGLRYTFQWGGRRLQQLHEFAHTGGCPALDVQLAFADHELRYDSKFSCFWSTKTEAAASAALRRGFGRGAC